MNTVLQARAIITAVDETGKIFDSVARRVEALGDTTRRVGQAAGSIGKIAGEVDRISGSVAKSSAAVDQFGSVLRAMDGNAAAIARVAALVDRAANTMPRLTVEAEKMSAAFADVAKAEKDFAAQQARIATATSRLNLFSGLQQDAEAARSSLAEVLNEMERLKHEISASEARRNQLRGEVAASKAAADTIYKTAQKTAPKQHGVKQISEEDNARYQAALAAYHLRRSQIIEETSQRAKLKREVVKQSSVLALANAAVERQEKLLAGVQKEFEDLVGPIHSVAEAEERLKAAAEAATQALGEQGQRAVSSAEGATAALAREEHEAERLAKSRARWAREFASLEAHAHAERLAVAPPRRTAVEELVAAQRQRQTGRPPTKAEAEAGALAEAQLRLRALAELEQTAERLRSAARQAASEALRLRNDVRAAPEPSKVLLGNYDNARSATYAATEAMRQQDAAVKALRGDIEAVIGPIHSLAAAQEELERRTAAAGKVLQRETAMQRRLHAIHRAADELLPFEGPEILHLTHEAFQQGAELQHERVGLQNAGRTPEEIERIELAARNAAAELPTATYASSQRIIAETTGAFGSLDHAIEHLQFMQRATSVLKAAAGDKIEGGPGEIGQHLAKYFEERMQPPEDFEKEAGSLIPAMVATGGVFNPQELYHFAQQAKSALPGYGSMVRGFSSDFMRHYAPSLIAASGGERAGTAASAFDAVIAGRARDKKQAAEWMRLDLLDPNEVLSGKDGPIGWKAGAVKRTDLASSNPVEWAEHVLIPAMEKGGVNINDRLSTKNELATLFRNGMSNFFANEIAQAQSLKRLHKDADLYDRVGSLNDIYQRNLHQDPTVALTALGTSIANFAATLTGPGMSDAAGALAGLASGIGSVTKSIADFDAAHPDIAKAIAGVSLATGTAIGGILTAKLFGALGSALSGHAGDAAALTGSAAQLDGAAVRLDGAAVAITESAGALRGAAAAAAAEGAGGAAAEDAAAAGAAAAPGAARSRWGFGRAAAEGGEVAKGGLAVEALDVVVGGAASITTGTLVIAAAAGFAILDWIRSTTSNKRRASDDPNFGNPFAPRVQRFDPLTGKIAPEPAPLQAKPDQGTPRGSLPVETRRSEDGTYTTGRGGVREWVRNAKAKLRNDPPPFFAKNVDASGAPIADISRGMAPVYNDPRTWARIDWDAPPPGDDLDTSNPARPADLQTQRRPAPVMPQLEPAPLRPAPAAALQSPQDPSITSLPQHLRLSNPILPPAIVPEAAPPPRPSQIPPPASAATPIPLPVKVVEFHAPSAITAMPLGTHRDFTIGNEHGSFSPGLRMGDRFEPWPGMQAPNAPPAVVHPDSDGGLFAKLAGLMSAIRIADQPRDNMASLIAAIHPTIEGPITAQLQGSAIVSADIKVGPSSELLAIVSQAKSIRAAGNLSAGGSSGSVGPSRTDAAPNSGKSRQ